MSRVQLVAVLLGAAMAGCANVPAQPPIEVVRIHEVAGRTKAELCRAARDWAAVTFKDSKAVVEVYDPEAGSMIGKGVFMIPAFTEQWPARFTLIVECKDGRARATYRDVTVSVFISGSRYEAPPNDGGLVKARTFSEQKLFELDASLDAGLKKEGSNW